MPERVIDASVALKWVVKSESDRKLARRLLSESQAAGITLIAPPLFESETESMIQEQVYLGNISVSEADRAIRVLNRTAVQIIHDDQLKDRARQIARRFNQRRVYDSTYAALAELRGCEFWTADKAFFDAVKTGLAFVKFLPSIRER